MDNVSKKGRKDAWKEERKKGGWMDGWMDGWTDRRTDEYQGTKKAWVEDGWIDSARKEKSIGGSKEEMKER